MFNFFCQCPTLGCHYLPPEQLASALFSTQMLPQEKLFCMIKQGIDHAIPNSQGIVPFMAVIPPYGNAPLFMGDTFQDA